MVKAPEFPRIHLALKAVVSAVIDDVLEAGRLSSQVPAGLVGLILQVNIPILSPSSSQSRVSASEGCDVSIAHSD